MDGRADKKVESLKIAGVRRLLDRGVKLIEQESYGAALESFRRAYDLDPESIDAAVCLAQELYMQGRTEESEHVVRRALEKRHNVEMLRLLTAILLDDDARRDETVDVIRRVRDDCGDATAAKLLEGHYEIEKANGRRALELFQQVLEADPGNEEASEGMSRALNLVGIDLSEEGRNEEAVFIFKQSSKLDPWWSAPHVNLGNCHSALDHVGLARVSYLRGIELEPDNPQAHFNLGRLLIEENELDSAESEFLCVLDIDPDYTDVHGELGRVYSLQGRFDSAIFHCEKEIEANPDCVPCMCNLAIACICGGDMKKGEDLLKKSLDIEEDPFTLYTLAGLYASLNRESDSIGMLERAATFRPGWLSDYLHSDEKFERFRSNKRFLDIIERLAESSK